MRLVKKWVALPRTPREKGTLHVDRYTAPTKSVVAFQPNLLHYAHGFPPRLVRRRLLTISLLTLFSAFVALGTRSHFVEERRGSLPSRIRSRPPHVCQHVPLGQC
jgi:hypothetical protein